MGSHHACSNLLLTGSPGVGKTTVVQRIAQQLPPQAIQGFVTGEVRVAGKRTGFRIETLDGGTAMLAEVGRKSRYRVGRYGVDIEALERIVDLSLSPSAAGQILIVDEIGKMECCSRQFVQAVRRLLAHPCLLVATVALHGRGLITEVKSRPDVTVMAVTMDNRHTMPATVLQWLDRNPAG